MSPLNATNAILSMLADIRVIGKPLNGFGKLDEVEVLRKQENGTFGKSGIRIRDFENMKRDDDKVSADYLGNDPFFKINYDDRLMKFSKK